MLTYNSACSSLEKLGPQKQTRTATFIDIVFRLWLGSNSFHADSNVLDLKDTLDLEDTQGADFELKIVLVEEYLYQLLIESHKVANFALLSMRQSTSVSQAGKFFKVACFSNNAYASDVTAVDKLSQSYRNGTVCHVKSALFQLHSMQSGYRVVRDALVVESWAAMNGVRPDALLEVKSDALAFCKAFFVGLTD